MCFSMRRHSLAGTADGSKAIWMRSGCSGGSICWVLLFRGGFAVSQTIIPEVKGHFLIPLTRPDTHLFGGLGLKGALQSRRGRAIRPASDLSQHSQIVRMGRPARRRHCYARSGQGGNGRRWLLLGQAQRNRCANPRPGTYDIALTGIVFRGTSEIERQTHEWNSQFRVAVGWYTHALN